MTTEKKPRVKKSFAERQNFRRAQATKLLTRLEKAAKKAPGDWGTVFRNAVASALGSMQFVNAVQIPEDYKRGVGGGISRKSSGKIDVGSHVTIRSKARRDSYSVIVPEINSVGTVTDLVQQGGVNCAFVMFGQSRLGPVPIRFLTVEDGSAKTTPAASPMSLLEQAA